MLMWREFVREFALTFYFGWGALYIGHCPQLHLQWWARVHTCSHSKVVCFGITTVLSSVLLGFVRAFYLVCLVLCNDEICFGVSAYYSGGGHCSQEL